MLNNLISTRMLQIAASLTLCSFAITSHAAPYSLQGSCHLTSIIPGQAECYVTAFVTDNDFITPTTLRRAVIKINGITVSDHVNDNLNPLGTGFTGAAGAVEAPCGMNHSVAAFVAPVGSSFVKAGSLPNVRCPAAP